MRVRDVCRPIFQKGLVLFGEEEGKRGFFFDVTVVDDETWEMHLIYVWLAEQEMIRHSPRHSLYLADINAVLNWDDNGFRIRNGKLPSRNMHELYLDRKTINSFVESRMRVPKGAWQRRYGDFPKDARLLKDLLREHYEFVETVFTRDGKFDLTKDFEESIPNFLFLVSFANFLLLPENRETESSEETQKTEKTTRKFVEIINGDRIVRNYTSGLHIRARKSAKRQIDAVHYHMPNWTVRGHWRKYKSGKTVWIEATTHNRKCMQKKEKTQTIVRITE